MRVPELFNLTLHDGHESGEISSAPGTLSSGDSLCVVAGLNARKQKDSEGNVRCQFFFCKIIQQRWCFLMETQRVVVCRLCFLVVGHVAHLTLFFSASLWEFMTASRCQCTPTFSCSCARSSSCSAATVLQVGRKGLVSHLQKAVRRSAALQVTSSLTFWSGRGPNEAVVWVDVLAVCMQTRRRTSFPSISSYTIRFSIENNIISIVFTFRATGEENTHTRTRGKRYKIEVPSAEPPRTAEWQRLALRNLRRKLEQSATSISSRIPSRCMQRAR